MSSVDHCLLYFSLLKLVFIFFKIFYATLAVCFISEVGVSVIDIEGDFQRHKW